jgi:hypothetical protein
MIAPASCRLVSRNEPTAGGRATAISAIKGSGMTPGPLGISDTRPTAEAPESMAVQASSTLAMQQILILVTGMAFSVVSQPVRPPAKSGPAPMEHLEPEPTMRHATPDRGR